MSDEFSERQMEQIRSAVVIGVGEALEAVVLPRLHDLEDGQQKLVTGQQELREDFGRLERKLDATINVTDRHDVRLKRVEKLPM